VIACALRTTVVYLVLIAAVRLMGKRQIGQLEASEFVVTMLAANLAALPIEDPEFSMAEGITAIAVLAALEQLLSLGAMRSIRFRKLLCGKPVILIENGKILRENLRRTRIHLDELTGHLRQKDVLDLRTVKYAVLETDGSLSVFLWAGERPATAKEAGIRGREELLPVTIISDGTLLKENLQVAGKDRAWVDRVLKQRGAEIGDTLLLTVDRSDRIVFYSKLEG
jgi:uncharacterized membrane protein YcaP (DUF421 family)